ncbi:MAG TPA: phytanoyl-CoA dioxygenase family protein [Dongiaceae bacterium]|nr:phytanoyl-CoA dioxygenase family protein [Dongiaceae bacterium]
MGGLLAERQIEDYRRDGFLSPVTVMSGERALAYRQALEAAEARFGPMHYVTKPHLLLRMADELVHHELILDAVEDIIGPDILLWDSTFIIKEPGDGKYVSWHQDLTYWGLEPDDVVSIWLALSPATVESGCMRMVPGSHRSGRVDHVATFASGNLLSRGQTIAVRPDEERAVDLPLRPGQMSMHHGWTFHASHPNRSSDRRIGLNMNLIAPNVRQTRFAGDSAMLLRGEDRYGHFAAEPRPSEDFGEAARALQLAINARRGLDAAGKAVAKGG